MTTAGCWPSWPSSDRTTRRPRVSPGRVQGFPGGRGLRRGPQCRKGDVPGGQVVRRIGTGNDWRACSSEVGPSRAHPFRNLPLFWKLLVPYLTLIVIVGMLGAFLIVRELSGRADASINADLSRRALAAGAALRDKELYLLESGTFAANVQGMAEAVRQGDAAVAGNLLGSVLALKADLSLAVVTGADGRGLAEFVQPARGILAPASHGRGWTRFDFVSTALSSSVGDRAAGFIVIDGTTMLALASPICSSSPSCSAVGVAIVALSADQLLATVVPTTEGVGAASEAGVAVYASDGRLLAGTGAAGPVTQAPPQDDQPLRRLSRNAAGHVATLYTPLVVQGRRNGTLAVTLGTEQAFGAVRSTALRLAVVVLLAMLGIVAIGAMLSRYILAELRPLLGALRSLGAGDLRARAQRVGNDELGQVAEGVNAMAEQLAASYETLELRVEERTAEVQRLLLERTQFFAAMSHEFRTPVAVVLSQAQMLSDPTFPKSDRWQADAGRILHASGEQLLSLVSDILELARAEVGKLDVELDDVSLPALVRDLRPTIDGLAHAVDLRTKISAPARLPAVRADRHRLRQVLLNLVDNAVKYTPAGGTVSVSTTVTEAGVALVVSDTGVGIPAQDAEQIFEPFYRVRANRTQHGQPSSGLGLAVTKRLVEAQGGTICFTSNAGQGTTFVVTFPVASPQAAVVDAVEPRARTRALR